MKKFVIYLVCIMIGSFVIGVVTFKTGGGFKANKVNIDQSKEFAIEGVKNIEVDTTYEAVTVKKTSGSVISAHLKGEMFGKDSYTELSTELSQNGRLSISLHRKGNFIFINDWGNLKLEILLPETYSGELNVSSNSGKLDISEIALSKVALNTTSGRIEGYLGSGAVEAETVSGQIDLTMTKLDNNLSLKSTSGRINLTIPKESDYNFKMSTTSGGFHNLTSDQINKIDRENYEGGSGQKTYNININTVSGSVELNKK